MKRRILAMALSLLMIVHTGFTVLAVDEKEVLEQVQMQSEVYSASGEQYVLQQGAMGTVYSPADSEDVLSGDYEWEAEFRERLAIAMENYETQVNISDLEIGIEREKFLEIYWNEINRNPQCFYINGYVSWWYDSAGNYATVTLGYEDEYVKEDGSLDTSKLNTDRKTYENRVNEALSYTDDSMTDLEKLLAVHDFIVRECDYDYANYLQGSIPQESYSAYGVLVNNVAVCNGYTLALMDCLNRLGISNYFVSSDEINHAWNLVYLDGYWYHVDSTWDDPISSSNNDYVLEGRIYHNNFVLSDKEITDTGHTGWDETVPEATNNGSYADYCFRTEPYYYAMNYYGGYWYYLTSSRQIVRSDITGDNLTEVCTGSNYKYLHIIEDAMYLADNTGIYKLSPPDFNDPVAYRIFTNEDAYIDSTLTEFSIKNSKLVVVLNDNNTDEDQRLVLDIEGLDTPVEFYTVTFECNGGSGIDTSTHIEEGQLVVQPMDPVKDGYSFRGWYADEGLTIPWNFAENTITADTTLYAKWEIIPVQATSVELSKTELTMEIGSTATLDVTVLPENTTDKNVTWTSSNTEVATVENGVVTAVAAGSATITVITANNITATCTVTVMEAVVEVTSVKLSESMLNMEVGDTALLTATVLPENATDKTIIWSSSNTAVATVENGNVTSVQPGYALITATAGNGLSAQCTVIVSEEVVEVTEVVLNYTSVTMTEGDVLTLSASLLPEGAVNNSMSWRNDNGLVVDLKTESMMTATVTALQAGKATVTVVAENGTTAICQITVIEEEPRVVLADVPEGWKYDAAIYVFEKGIMTGKDTDENGDVIFDPDASLSRQEFAQIIYASEGKPQGETVAEFTDVAAGQWYTNAVLWAADQGIVSGIGDGMFGVDKNITREQLALMLYQYAGLEGYDRSNSMELDGFVDEEAVSGWSETALKWAVANGVMSGKAAEDGTSKKLDPQGEATRAECAAMLRTFMQTFAE